MESRISPELRQKITDKGLQDLVELVDNLDEIDKKHRHEPTTLWCLACGQVIRSDFTGGLWSYTHCCNGKKGNYEQSCRAFGTKFGILIPASFVVNGSWAKHKCDCKTKEEHLNNSLRLYLGSYEQFEIKDEPLKLRNDFIQFVKDVVDGKFDEK